MKAVKTSDRTLLFLPAIYVLLLLFIVVWTVYVHPTKHGIFQRAEMLWDEGGHYVSMATRVNDASQIIHSTWYRYIREHLDEASLYLEWGRYAGRVQLIFSDLIAWNTYVRLLGWLGAGIGSYVDAYYCLMLLLPLWVAVKYLYCWLICPAERRAGLLLAFVVADFAAGSHINWWFTSEAYGWHALSAGLFTLLAGYPRWLVWLWMAITVSFNWYFAPVVVAVLLADAACRSTHPRVRAMVTHLQRHWLRSVWGLMAAAIVLAGVVYAVAVLRTKAGHGDPYQLLEVFAVLFRGTLRSIDPTVVTLAIVVAWLRSSQPASVPEIAALPLATLLTLVCGSLIIGISGLTSGVVPENGGRHMTHIMMLLMIEGALFMGASERPVTLDFTRLWRQPPTPRALILAVPLAIGIATFGYQLPIRQSIQLGAGGFPVQETNRATGCTYYVADNAQQVYGYFIHRDYRQAPLLLNLKSGRYTIDEAVRAVCNNAAKLY